MTLREHLSGIAASVPAAAQELFGPPQPPYTEVGWELFWRLHATRGVTEMGLAPITYAEMVAYERLTRTRMTPFDVLCVREADDALLCETRDRITSAQAATPAPPSPLRES